ncbi:MAG: hypothetical protein QOG87_3025 [Actinomycetota bacterium]|jgi:hypothetical protein
MPHQFLSDDWLAEVKKISDELGAGSSSGPDITVNVVVTEGPEGDRELHLENGVFGTGLVDGAPTKLTLPYSVATDMFVSGNQQAAMQAFMAGQIKVEGDMTKLMAMQSQGGGSNPELTKRLKEITAV